MAAIADWAMVHARAFDLLADVRVCIGVRSERREVEHGERFEHVYGMLLAIACMHAGLVAVRRRFEPRVLVRCLLY
jgi:hypothetical protein